jgi:hypothetical protein
MPRIVTIGTAAPRSACFQRIRRSLPTTGYSPLVDGFGPWLAHMILPVATLTIGGLADRAGACGADDAEDDAEHRRAQERADDERQRGLQPVGQHLGDRDAADDRGAQVALEEVPEPAPVLRPQGEVEAELRPHLLVPLRRRGRTHDRPCRVTRGERDEDEDQRRDDARHLSTYDTGVTCPSGASSTGSS